MMLQHNESKNYTTNKRFLTWGPHKALTGPGTLTGSSFTSWFCLRSTEWSEGPTQ